MRKQYFFRPSPQGLLTWDVHQLVRLTRDLPVRSVPLSAIRDLDGPVSGDEEPATWRSFVAHVQLLEAADLAYPIILAADGSVMDGMHRVAKALRDGLERLHGPVSGRATPGLCGTTARRAPLLSASRSQRAASLAD